MQEWRNKATLTELREQMNLRHLSSLVNEQG